MRIGSYVAVLMRPGPERPYVVPQDFHPDVRSQAPPIGLGSPVASACLAGSRPKGRRAARRVLSPSIRVAPPGTGPPRGGRGRPGPRARTPPLRPWWRTPLSYRRACEPPLATVAHHGRSGRRRSSDIESRGGRPEVIGTSGPAIRHAPAGGQQDDRIEQAFGSRRRWAGFRRNAPRRSPPARWPRRVPPRESAWRGSRPCPPPDTAGGLRPATAPSRR